MLDSLEKIKKILVSLANNEGWEQRGCLEKWEKKLGAWSVSSNEPPRDDPHMLSDSVTIWFHEKENNDNRIGFDIERAKHRTLSTISGSLPNNTKIHLDRISGMWELRKYLQNSLKQRRRYF